MGNKLVKILEVEIYSNVILYFWTFNNISQMPASHT